MISDVSIRIGADFVGKKGITEAERSVKRLQKNVRNLAAGFGLAFGTRALINFSRVSIAAFKEEEKSASALANTMKNLGLQFSNPVIEQFIENLSMASGVADDQLRPAMQKLLQVNGSVVNSQKMLSQALDISRATGVDLVTVSADLAQAYVGNYRGLRKYNIGLTQAELATASFATVQERLLTLFSGANAAYLDTYAGKLDKLSVASGEAKEIIGKGLVQALENLGGGGGQGLDRVISSMKYLSTLASDFVRGVGGQVGAIGKLLTGDVKGAAALLASSSSKESYKGAIPSIAGMVQASEQKKAEAAAVKRQKELVALQKKQVAATKAITASKKASAIFDMEQIQIVAALKGKITEEEAIRLRLQSAILMGNNEEASRLTIELSKTVGMTQELSTWLRNLPTAKNPFEAWQSYLDGIMGTLQRIATQSIPSAGFSMGGGAGYELPVNPYAGTYYGETGRDPMPVNIVISTTDQFTSALRYDLLDSSLSGSQAQLSRNLGSFA